MRLTGSSCCCWYPTPTPHPRCTFNLQAGGWASQRVPASVEMELSQCLADVGEARPHTQNAHPPGDFGTGCCSLGFFEPDTFPPKCKYFVFSFVDMINIDLDYLENQSATKKYSSVRNLSWLNRIFPCTSLLLGTPCGHVRGCSCPCALTGGRVCACVSFGEQGSGPGPQSRAFPSLPLSHISAPSPSVLLSGRTPPLVTVAWMSVKKIEYDRAKATFFRPNHGDVTHRRPTQDSDMDSKGHRTLIQDDLLPCHTPRSFLYFCVNQSHFSCAKELA